VAFLLTAGRSATTTRIVLVTAAAATAIVLIVAASGATAATRRLHRQVGVLRAASARGQDDLRLLAEKAQRGEYPAPVPEAFSGPDSDLFAALARDLQRERHAAQQAVAQTATLVSGGGPDQRVEVFVNLARRMQSLVHREIQLLDDLEGQVEDPVLLKGLFTVDHLATRMRRQSESLAVLGGAVSRRQWSRPVTMHEVLRAAVAEVEQYSRVKVVPPVEGTLLGSAVTDVIHLVAELIENAAKFSPPHTQALLRAQNVTAGLAIEVEDRGLGMLPADQQRMNVLLADPGRVNISELLRDGRIGLFVVSALARRHGIRVQLRGNIYGGIQAVVVLPKALIEAGLPQREREPEQLVPPGPARPAVPPPPAVPPVRPETRPGGPPAPAADRPARPAPPAQPAQPPAPGGERPSLPQRRGHTHLAQQLRDAPTARRDEPAADQIPGLMAAFQQGVSRAVAEDSRPGPPARAH
jgi:signal transduction histidine kinase